jgi:lysophospholipase L1-like esterase
MTIQPNPRIRGVLFPGADSLALRLPAGCGQVIAVWYDTGTFDTVGGYVNRRFSLSAYVIECHASPDDALPGTGWETLLTVTDNRLSTRQHLLDLGGCRWVRIRFLRFAGVPELRFDIHDAADGISDSWLFLGDSITACAMVNAWGTSFAEHIHALDPRFYPVQQNGGIGGLTSREGREHVREWLAGNPARFVPVAFGTNDAWGEPNDLGAYEANIRYMLDAVLDAGKHPVLPTIPFASDSHAGRCTADYNAVIERLYAAYGDTLLHGPDLYAFFRENPHLLGEDGVHPSQDGYEAMRKLWAETMFRALYTISI